MANKKETEHLAHDFMRVAERYYTSWPQLLLRSFASGLFTALGATLGLGIVLWIASFLFSHLALVPIVGDFFIQVDDFVKSAAR
jgi:hypothetical protein